MSRVRAGAALTIFGAVWGALVVVIFGARYPHYSHMTNFISALGGHGARDGFVVSWFGFAVTGTAVAVGTVLMRPALRFASLAATGVALAGISTAVGYVGSAVYRCDFGCPEKVHSSTQSVHFFVSGADLVGLSIGIALVAWALRRDQLWSWLSRFSLVAFVLIFLGANVLTNPAVDGWAGLLQRVIEGLSYSWFVVVGLAVWRNDKPPGLRK